MFRVVQVGMIFFLICSFDGTFKVEALRVSFFAIMCYTILGYCGNEYRGLVKWYDRGLQNLWWGFDSLIPCFKEF